MSGFGLQPMGVGPFGVGTPATASETAGTPQNDESLQSKSARYIDPITRQYAFDANGRMRGMGAVPQKVQLIAATVLGSSAVRELGNDIHEIEDAGDDLEVQIRTRWERAYAGMVRAKEIAILAIEIARFSNAGGRVGAKTRIRYRDLTTGIEQTVTT